MWCEAEADLGQIVDEAATKTALCQRIGLVQDGLTWCVPDGYIAVTKEGPAEEYIKGFFRHPDALRLEGGKITAIMADDEGYGRRIQIIGITPKPKSPADRPNWRDGLTVDEIDQIVQKDEEKE